MNKKLNEIVLELIDHGLSEGEIASKLSSMGISCTQPTIHRIKTEKVSDPRYSIGAGIKSLHAQIIDKGAA